MLNRIYFLTIALLCGCSTPQFTEADRANVHTVAVSRKVTMPSRIVYNGPGQIIGSQFGLIGVSISAGTSLSTSEKLKRALATNNVSVPDILTTTFERELASSNLFTVIKDPVEADATFYLTVKQYGIYGGIMEPLHGMLWIEASLTNRAGKLIWRDDTQRHGDKKKIPDLDFNHLINDPKHLTETFENPSAIVSQDIIKMLTPKPKK